ncbi:MAG: hypothetical protein IK055_08050 [Lachnospiraceae bacterium]|nr:hypothetical protein [Lachnospiraceae bacterium]
MFICRKSFILTGIMVLMCVLQLLTGCTESQGDTKAKNNSWAEHNEKQSNQTSPVPKKQENKDTFQRKMVVTSEYVAWVNNDGTVKVKYISSELQTQEGIFTGDVVGNWKNVVSLNAGDILCAFTEDGQLESSPNYSAVIDGMTSASAVVWPYLDEFTQVNRLIDGRLYGYGATGVLLTSEGSLYYVCDFSDTIESALKAEDVETFDDVFYLKADGSIHSFGKANASLSIGLDRIANRSDYIGLAVNRRAVFGLTSDGIVVTGNTAYSENSEAAKWTNVVKVVAGGEIVFALRQDGTVRYALPGGRTDEGFSKVLKWNNIREIAVSQNGTEIAALTESGDILMAVGEKSVHYGKEYYCEQFAEVE